MINKAIQIVRKLEKNKMEKDIAYTIKKEFDTTFHPTWQWVVGRNFGSEIGYESEHMLYFYWGSIAILIWKAG